MKKKSNEMFSDFIRKHKKILLTMKVFVFLLFSISASASMYSQGEMVSIKTNNASLEEIITSLKGKTNYGFLYNNKEIDKIKSIDVSLSNIPIEEALSEIFNDLNIGYKIVKDVIIITPKLENNKLQVQATTIKGRVQDKDGYPLAGATILVDGTTNGTATDFDGSFTLVLNENTLNGSMPINLVFSSIGFEVKIIKYTGQSNINIVLEENVESLDEVILTGLFTRKKESFTGSSTTIESEELRTMGVDNVVQSLALLDPSLQIFQNNSLGSDPNRLPQLRIRGEAVFNAPGLENISRNALDGDPNLPIFILDNFPSSLERVIDLDMTRVKSVTILKDAAATAIYGSRAANGVIVITTKQPKSGRLNITYNYLQDHYFPDLESYDLLGAQELFDLQKDLGIYKYTGSLLSQTLGIEKFIAQGVDTDWLAQPVQNTIGTRHSLSLSGGSDAVIYQVNLSLADRPGVMKGSERKNTQIQQNLQYNANDKLFFRNSFWVDWNNQQESPFGSFTDYTNLPGYFPINDNKGRPIQTWTYDVVGNRNAQERYGRFFNPVHEASVGNYNKTNSTQITNNFSLDWTIIDALRFRVDLGYSSKNTRNKVFTSPNSQIYRFGDIETDERGIFTNLNIEEQRINVNTTLNYAKEFGKHFLNANMGLNTVENIVESYGFTAVGFPSERFTNPSFSAGYERDGIPVSTEGTTRLAGAVASINYSYDNRYLLDASYRLDGSSQFGTDDKKAGFYSLGLGWNIHNESFFSNSKFINQFRLRSTYGETGSVNFAPYQAKNTVTFYNDFRYLDNLGAYIIGLGNETLRWQTTENIEYGTDIGLFDNRFSLTFNVYNKKTTDLVTPITTPPSVGFNSFSANLGSLENKGYEFNVRAILLKKDNFQWSVYGNGLHNESRILQIGNSLKQYNEFGDEGGSDEFKQEFIGNSDEDRLNQASHNFLVRFEEGRSNTAIYAVRSLGIDPATGEELFLTKDGVPTFNWNPKDRVVVGDTAAKLQGTIGSTIVVNNFDINFAFQYAFGGQVYNQTLVDRIENSNKAFNVDRRVLEETWMQPGDNVQFKNNYSNGQISFTPASSRFVQDNDFLQLSSIAVNYNVPREFSNKLGMQSVRLSINANDIFYISTVRRERGLDYPFARNVTFSLRTNF